MDYINEIINDITHYDVNHKAYFNIMLNKENKNIDNYMERLKELKN